MDTRARFAVVLAVLVLGGWRSGQGARGASTGGESARSSDALRSARAAVGDPVQVRDSPRAALVQAWGRELDQAGARFGSSVSAAGDVNGDGYGDLIAGAPNYDDIAGNEGLVCLYLGTSTGFPATPDWTYQSLTTNGYAGISVALAGDVNGDGYSDVVLGAVGHANGEFDEGGAFAFYGSPSGLAATPDWAVESNDTCGFMGQSVACAGDVNGDGYSDVIVGAPGFTDGESAEGSAFVYHGSAAGLSATPDWSTQSDQAMAYLGHSVAAAGDVDGDGYGDVVVGAPMYDLGFVDVGRAEVFLGSATGLATSPAWSRTGSDLFENLGFAVAPAGDVNGDGFPDLAVGSPGWGGGADTGRIQVFHGSAGGLSAGPDFTDTGALGSRMGHSLAAGSDFNGDGYSDVLTGGPEFSDHTAGEGAAYTFLGGPGGLDSNRNFFARGGQVDAAFGWSVGTAGDVDGDGFMDALVGAFLYDSGEVDEGVVFLYLGQGEGLLEATSWSVTGASFMGESVAPAGDVNGDGYDDALVTDMGYSNGEPGEGAAFAYFGSATGLLGVPTWTVEGNEAGAGLSVASTAGDVNGDGYADVIIGVPRAGGLDEGRAFVRNGSPTGPGTVASWSDVGAHGIAMYGGAVSTAGDVNGDGFADVIVGASDLSNGNTREGAAYVYLGSASGLADDPAWTVEGTRNDGFLGSAVACAGDVNGDGYSDVIVGARGIVSFGKRGRAFVYHGSKDGLAVAPDWTGEGEVVTGSFGNAVASAGDVNGDGYSDVIVGDLGYGAQSGRAYVYLGSSGGLLSAPAWTGESTASALYGSAVSSAGDVNGDGYSDVLVGAHNESPGGRVFLYLGSPSGPSVTADWTVASSHMGARFGGSVAVAGDVDGDGFDDVLVGAPSFGTGGEARAYPGNLGLGSWVRLVRQDTSLLGLAPHPDFFGIRLQLPRGIPGLGWASPVSPVAYLEWEVKMIGQPFDGQGLERSAVGQAVTLAGLPLQFDELAARTAGHARTYRWRVRVAFDGNPLFAHTPWYSSSGNNITEAKLRFPHGREVARSAPVAR